MDNAKTLDGRTALVTGGTSGIGYYTAEALACLGAEVFVTGRDQRRGQDAVRQLQAAAGYEKVHFIRADASTVGGNRLLARSVLATTGQLHILVNNVGGLYTDRWETDDGYEATLAMNLVGPFALTEAVLPALRRSAPARIVNVASAGFSMWKGDLFEDLHARRSYNGSEAYARAKYLNILWTLALARRLEGSRVVANAVHPGTAWTAMNQNSDARVFPASMRPFYPLLRLIQRSGSPKKAARTSVFLASSPEAANLTGQYFESSTRPKGLPVAMLDPSIQEKTWDLAEALTTTTVSPVEIGIPAG